MTFSITKFNKKTRFLLIRFCETKKYTSIMNIITNEMMLLLLRPCSIPIALLQWTVLPPSVIVNKIVFRKLMIRNIRKYFFLYIQKHICIRLFVRFTTNRCYAINFVSKKSYYITCNVILIRKKWFFCKKNKLFLLINYSLVF